MKPHLLVLALLSASLAPAFAITPAEFASSPAKIEARAMKEVPLVLSNEKKGWIEIPKRIAAYHPTIFRPDKDQQGVTEFTVTEGGYLLLACNYDYQGNDSDNWQDEVWYEKDFKKHGWKMLGKGDLGGVLIQSDNRPQVIFYKVVNIGEHYKLRCNKYDPPYPILLH